jgi:dTDP-4-amino-4,6-dideoxygalactose transaminase
MGANRCGQLNGRNILMAHSVAVNSNTSGLIGRRFTGIEPGDEVIVSPWTMSASATSTDSVFADIEDETFNLIQLHYPKYYPYTRAIMLPDITAADLDAIMDIAQHDLRAIEDNSHSQRLYQIGTLERLPI